MKKLFLLILLIIISQLTVKSQTNENKITIDASEQGYKIDKNIYGQFSEHLGHCIYGGIWVGEDSPIPNTDGIRNDVVGSIEKIKSSCATMAGRLFCR